MPNDVYDSSYTGNEIDEAIGKIINNGQSSILIVYSDGEGGIKFAPLPNIEASTLKATAIPNGKVLISNDGGVSWIDLLVDEGNIDSGSASSGKVLTADGVGGASWAPVSGGGGSYTATSPLAIVSNDIRITPNSQNYPLVLISQNGSIQWGLITKDAIVATGASSGQALVANSLGRAVWGEPVIESVNLKATGIANNKILSSYEGGVHWVDLLVDKDEISSGTATSGQVLTANGSGGVSWETPSGGTPYTEGNGIKISQQNQISNDGVLSFASKKGVITIGSGLTMNSNELSNTGVLSIASSSGYITLGTGLSMSSNQISNTGVLSIGGQNGAIVLGTGLAINGNTLSVTGGSGSYSEGNGITITQNGEIGITSAIADSGKILRVNSSGSVYWDDIIETEYIDVGAYTDDYVLCAGTTAHWRRVDPNIFS